MPPPSICPICRFPGGLGPEQGPLPLIVHFLYGIFWALVLFALFEDRVTVVKGLGVAGFQWLLFMAVFAPVIGWGFFGIGGPGHELPSSAPLYIGSTLKFLVLTLVLHGIYGWLNGWLIPRWATRSA